jgi:hypothetical protein
VGFLVDKVALGQDFLPISRFSPVNIILPWLFMRMNNRSIDGHSSKTSSHTFNNNNNNNNCFGLKLFPARLEIMCADQPYNPPVFSMPIATSAVCF